MSDYTTKDVISDFTYARGLMAEARQMMKIHRTSELKSNGLDWDDVEQVANELIAAVSTFAAWVEQESGR